MATPLVSFVVFFKSNYVPVNIIYKLIVYHAGVIFPLNTWFAII